jgi:hypothetical protein
MERESNHERVRIILEQEFLEALQRRDFASSRFGEVNQDIPSGLPHPDGKQRIYRASREYSAALQELSRALRRLTDFREHGIVPEDLKPLG